jgi:hypothetical protein
VGVVGFQNCLCFKTFGGMNGIFKLALWKERPADGERFFRWIDENRSFLDEEK